MNFLNRCAVRANEGGTDNFVLVNGIPGFYTPPLCLNPTVVDGAEYNYFAVSDDGTQHEEGSGIWEAVSSQLFRTTIRNSSNAGAAVSFSAAPIVYMGGPTADDMGSGTTTSDVLNVTGAAGAFGIESLLGIRQVNLTAPDAGSYEININEYPIPGQFIEFILTEDSDPAATATFTEDVIVGNAALRPAVVTLLNAFEQSGDGNRVVLMFQEGETWGLASQKCRVTIDDFMTVLDGNFSGVANLIASPSEGDEISPCFPPITLRSSGEGAVNIGFEIANITNPSFVSFSQTAPGDSFNVDPSNFRNLDGSTPSAITFDTDAQFMSLFLAAGDSLLILSASPGVVTP